MSLRGMAMQNLEDPHNACAYGVTQHPLYHKCDICPNNAWCDIQLAVHYELHGEEMKQLNQLYEMQNLEREKIVAQEEKKLLARQREDLQRDLAFAKSFADKVRTFFNWWKKSTKEIFDFHQAN